MALDQHAEEAAKGRKRPFFLRRSARELREVAANVPGHDAGKLKLFALAPREEVPNRLLIGFPRVAVPDLPVEEVGPRLGGWPPCSRD